MLSHTQSLLCIQAFTHTILTSTVVYLSFHTHNPYFHNCVSKLVEMAATHGILPQQVTAVDAVLVRCHYQDGQPVEES